MPADTRALFAIDYDAARHVLLGRWQRDISDEDLYPSYGRLLAAAKTHDNCRFWLLDIRQRNWHTNTFAKWFASFLANRAAREVGTPIFIAYVVAEAHRAGSESVITRAMLHLAAQAELYPFFFYSEAAGYDWLEHYQQYPSTRPPLPTA